MVEFPTITVLMDGWMDGWNSSCSSVQSSFQLPENSQVFENEKEVFEL
jgi:hypothetical protein